MARVINVESVNAVPEEEVPSVTAHPGEEDSSVQSPSRVVLPAVPPLLAEAFCLLNCFTPGLGTLCSSLSCCCARTRGMSKSEIMASVLVGIFIALLQLLLTPVLLLGWLWSCFWGILLTAQSDTYYKPRAAQPERAHRILPRPLSAGSLQTQPEPPPPYTFYDDYFQRGQTPPPPYSPPDTEPVIVVTQPRTVRTVRTVQPVQPVRHSQQQGAHTNEAFESDTPANNTTTRASSSPQTTLEIVSEEQSHVTNVNRETVSEQSHVPSLTGTVSNGTTNLPDIG